MESNGSLLYQETIPTRTTKEEFQMTISELVSGLTNLCKENGLSYGSSEPVAVSPGVWMFDAIEMNDNCTVSGNCRSRQHYAVLKGSTFALT